MNKKQKRFIMSTLKTTGFCLLIVFIFILNILIIIYFYPIDSINTITETQYSLFVLFMLFLSVIEAMVYYWVKYYIELGKK